MKTPPDPFSPVQDMPTPIRRRVLLIAASALFAVALAELVLRAAFDYHGISDPQIFRHDPELGWTLQPNAHAWQSQLDFGITIDTDALGLRTQSGLVATRENRPPSKNVAMLGDSFAFGWGVDGGEMFSSALERELAGRPEKYSVHTLGVPGYSTDQEYLLWRRLSPQLRVDQVVLLFHESDLPGNVQDSVVMGRFRYWKPRFDLAGGRGDTGTGVGTIAARLQSPLAVPDKQEIAPGLFDSLKRPFGPLATYALAQTGFRTLFPIPDQPAGGLRSTPVTDALLAALDDGIRAKGASLLVALIPADAATTRIVKTICDAHRIAFLDLEPAFRGQSGVDLRYDGHWNARGHLLAARAVAPSIGRQIP